jgi:hypothetical protein
LTVGSSTIRAGESFTVSGGGFSAGERVEFALFSTPRALGGVIADASGSFTATLVLPRDVAAGDHTLRAVGSSSGVSAEAPVTVLAAADGAAPAPAPGSDDDGPLAVTGADIGGSLVAALLLLAVGAFLVIRRRRAQTGPAQDDARGHGRLVDR